MTQKYAMNGRICRPKKWASAHRAGIEFWLIIRFLQLVFFLVGFLITFSFASKSTGNPAQVARSVTNVVSGVDNIATGGGTQDMVKVTMPEETSLSVKGDGNTLEVCVMRGTEKNCEENSYSLNIEGDVTIEGEGYIGMKLVVEDGNRKILLAEGVK